MKNIFLFFTLFIFSLNISFAYNPTEIEQKTLSRLKILFEKQAEKKGELWIKRQINLFEFTKTKLTDDRKIYLVSYILNDLNIISNDLKKKNEEKLQKQLLELEAKKAEEIKQIQDYNTKARAFFDLYGGDITTSLSVNENCIKYFDFIDEIAKKNDFPTELIIATWGKEYNCTLGNPANGWGPFQITSQYYKPGDISLEEFGEGVQKYIDFTKGKWDYFNNNTYHNYKTRFGSENITITYDSYTIRDLKLTAILYNGVSKDTTLDGNTFANSNLNNSVTTNSDGIVTRFLKILNWRINR
ncbi:MAG: hypothetical protein PHI37_02330 [Candidatus Gracilibacteria bacterium]|nr:hypothetical protein [Candidatus Gracilibacteria bacterium]